MDGQENPLTLLESAKFYEVQKYCSITNHMWDGFWFLANRRAWDRLPTDVREVAARNLDAAALEQRGMLAEQAKTVRGKLEGFGMVFNAPELGTFPRRAEQERLLRRMEVQVRRRRLGAAGEILRQARLVLPPEKPAIGGRHEQRSRA